MVAITANHEQRRVIATVMPGTPWRAFHAAVRAEIACAPELTDYDWVIDDQGPMDDVDVDAMAASGEMFKALSSEADRTTFTVVVSSGRFFGEWARVLDKFYGNRRHYASPTLESAITLLDQFDSERVGGVPRPG